MNQIFIYDTTLRDGTQGEDFQLSVPEKLAITEILDDFGFHYIEGGWPGSNPRDEEYFKKARQLVLKNTRLAAFGSTRRAGVKASEDANLLKLVSAKVPVATIFGKSSRYQAETILKVSAEQNLEMVFDSVNYLKAHFDEVMFDAEHFFDGYVSSPDYAMKVLGAALEAGADFVVLCDTNGGSLPHQVSAAVEAVKRKFDCSIGIHAHDDSGLAVANSLEAVRMGASLVQGTVNGHGERCGNANLITVLPNLQLKMKKNCLGPGRLQGLTRLSRTLDEMTNYVSNPQQPFVGRRSFSHKGGVHINAVMKDTGSYEHIRPEEVGNRRRILASDLSGYSAIVLKAREFGLDLDSQNPLTRKVLERVKDLEYEGYQFEGAEASLMLLMHEAAGTRKEFFRFHSATVTTDLTAEPKTVGESSKAVVDLEVEGRRVQSHQTGNGPVHALANAFRDVLELAYPELREVRLVDYKVRILSSGNGFAATVRVLVQATDGRQTWGTVGVSTNIVEASRKAVTDALETKLFRERNADGSSASLKKVG